MSVNHRKKGLVGRMSIRKKTVLVVFGSVAIALGISFFFLRLLGETRGELLSHFLPVVFAGVLVGTSCYLFLEITVLGRIRRLHRSVEDVEAGKSGSVIIGGLNRRDETTDLAEVINKMISAERTLRIEVEQRKSLICAIIEAADVGLCVTDESKRILQVNHALCKMMGYRSEDLLKKPINTLFSNFSKHTGFWKAIESPTEDEDEGIVRKVKTNDGRIIDVIVRSGGMLSVGDSKFMVTALTDITDQIASEKRLRTILDTVQVGVALVNEKTGSIEETNHAFLELAGKMRGEVVSKPLGKFVHSAGGRLSGMFVTSADTQPKKMAGEFIFNDSNGKKITALGSCCRAKVGEKSMLLASFLDISERKKAENEFKKLSQAVEHSPASIVITDAEGIIEYVNPKFVQVSGYTFNEAIGQNPRLLKSDDKPSSEYKELWDTIKSGKEWRGEFYNKKKNGDLYWEHASISPIFNGGRKITHFVAVKEDITERKNTEEALHQRDRLLAASAEVGRHLLTKDYQAGIDRAIKALGQAADVDTVYIFQDRQDPKTHEFIASRRFEWLSKEPPDKATANMELQKFSRKKFLPRWWDILASGEVISGSVGDFPPDEREILQRYGIVSILVVPIMVEGDFWGFIGFDDWESERVWSENEIAILQSTAGGIGGAISRHAAKKKLEVSRKREVEIGARIQQTLLLGTIPDMKELDIASLTIPSKQIDGDFYDFIRHDDKCVDIIVGDVMGKGVPAALLGAAVKSSFVRAIAMLKSSTHRGKLPQPEQIVQFVQGEIAGRLIELDSFTTVLYARLDLVRGRVKYVDCGHTSTLHYKHRERACEYLKGDNVPLGFIEDEQYKQLSVPICEGDIILAYSDGITEAVNASGELFGTERLADVLRENSELSSEELCSIVKQEVVRYSGSDIFADDLTCVAVKITQIPDLTPVKRISREFPSDVGCLNDVRAFLRESCKMLLKFPQAEERLNEFELAAIESISNVMVHAHEKQNGSTITIDADLFDDRVEMKTWYDGKFFEAPAMTSTPKFDGSQEHGFGLYIIGQMVDDAEYGQTDDGRNFILLTKFFNN